MSDRLYLEYYVQHTTVVFNGLTINLSVLLKTKIELASEIITELIESGFNIELVLADSLSGESSKFLRKLGEYNLGYVVAISL